MKSNPIARSILFTISLFFSVASAANVDDQTLATVGPLQVTALDLERAVASSPFATQFVTMDPSAQAELRGDLLKRLVFSRLFRLEADREGLDKDPALKRELDTFREGLLYREYLDHLRALIRVPPDELAEMKKDYQENPDALAAARASYVASRYKALKLETLRRLRDRWHVRLYPERLKLDAPDDTVLMEGDDGMRITVGDVIYDDKGRRGTHAQWVEDQLYQRAEVMLVSRAALEQGVDVSDKVAAFKRERLPALLLERKIAEWIPDEKLLRDYYRDHKALGHVETRLHVGQLVVRTRGEAEALRKRIQHGESLFKLAGKYSIDPYGRSRNGDIGWVSVSKALPQIRAALANLPDDQVSEVIETPKGFQLIMILGRREGSQKPYAAVRDRVRQAYIDDKLGHYIGELSQRYQVVWNVLGNHRDK